MPAQYRCVQCDLIFSVGPFHYHSMDSGYFGCNLLACKACGTQHAYEAAMLDRGAEFDIQYDVSADAVPATGTIKFAQWISRVRKVSLKDALASARHLPLTVASHVWKHEAERLRAELVALGVDTSLSAVGQVRNTAFGPLQRDRLRFSDKPAHGQERQERGILELGEFTGYDSLECQHCHLRGTLVWEWQDDQACPSCKHIPMSVVSSWIT